MVQKVLCILIALLGGSGQPVDCSFLVIGSFRSGKVQLAQHILGVGISSLRRLGKPLHRSCGILLDVLAFETLLGQPVHGVVAAVDRSGVEPVHPLPGIPHFQIIREV